MKREKKFGMLWKAALLVAAVAVWAGPGTDLLSTWGSDHVDGPIEPGGGPFPADGSVVEIFEFLGFTSPEDDPRTDISDVFAFQSPTAGGRTVLIMTANPLAGVLSPTTFHDQAYYDFNVDTNGDAVEDIVYRIRFSRPNGNGKQHVTARRIPGRVIAQGETGRNVRVRSGGLLRADTFDDPFFVDLLAALGVGGRTLCDDGAFDTFGGTDVSAIVLEIPTADLGADSVRVWARTELDGNQLDRSGLPAVSAFFIPSEWRDAYNRSQPANDATDFAHLLPPFAIPDVLTLDTTANPGFFNGRRPHDDIFDITFQAVTGNPLASDCIQANDVPFRATFPYLGLRHGNDGDDDDDDGDDDDDDDDDAGDDDDDDDDDHRHPRATTLGQVFVRSN